MYFEIIDNTSLAYYMKIWKKSAWENVTYGDSVLNPNCLAFGVREQDGPVAVIVAEFQNEYAEIKILNYHSHNALKELMKKFSSYCHSLDINNLKYEIRILEEDEKIIKYTMIDNGWNEPQIKYKIFELKATYVPLSQKTKGNRPEGEIVPFFETTQKQRLELASKLSEDSCFYRMENLVDRICIAYLENDVINGFVLAESEDGGIYIEMEKMSAESVVIANLMTECADKVLENEIYKVYVRVKAKYGEQLIKNIFLKQILSSEVIMVEE